MVKPGSSNFRVITANFSDVRIFRIFTVYFYDQNSVKTKKVGAPFLITFWLMFIFNIHDIL